MTLLKKIPGTATAFSKEKQRPNETLSSQISLINIPASMREFKAKPIILRIIESDPSKCHSSYIFESNSNNHQCEKPKTSREMKESMFEREREREVSTTLAGGIEEESMVGGGNFIVWGHHQSLNMGGDFRLDMALGFHIGDSDFCYSEGYDNVCLT